ncbi:ParA family protein, partial [Klebsiella pneumoniae]|nr:ParA family protein [Klebsiella pneumoniae]
IFVVNLKGGVSKTVSTVTLAHALRVHQDLLRHDLRILVIDLDPQASSTMFLDHTHSIGTVLETAAQAMLNDLDVETLREAVIRPTIIPGVDVIPASIDDGFVASQWESLV